mmetsp:Transcript_3295/g.13066  ORF Transcript_3295/g.13066 Transcript_3295/m.13066 type:complete len:238 (+) Transcript_3295:113-826(+)
MIHRGYRRLSRQSVSDPLFPLGSPSASASRPLQSSTSSSSSSRHRPIAIGLFDADLGGGLSCRRIRSRPSFVPYAKPPPAAGWKHATFTSSSAEGSTRTRLMSAMRYTSRIVCTVMHDPPSATRRSRELCRRPYARSTCSDVGENCMDVRQCAARTLRAARTSPKFCSSSEYTRSSYTSRGMGSPGAGSSASFGTHATQAANRRPHGEKCAPISLHSTAWGMTSLASLSGASGFFLS